MLLHGIQIFIKKIHEIIIKNLKDCNYELYFRPHPMSLKNKEINIGELRKLGFKIDHNQVLNISNFTHLITDWSGIFIEFAIVKKIKPILFNTSLSNSDRFKQLNNEDFEYFSRDLIGHEIDIDDVKNLKKIILNSYNLENRKDTENYFNKYFYN